MAERTITVVLAPPKACPDCGLVNPPLTYRGKIAHHSVREPGSNRRPRVACVRCCRGAGKEPV